MLNATKEFIDFLDHYKIYYNYAGNTSQAENEQITLKITSNIVSDLTINFIFDSNNQIVYIRIWNFIKVPAACRDLALSFINNLNSSYRFVRFYLNTETNTIDIFVDSFIQSGAVGRTCLNLCVIIAKICDSVYPEIIKSFEL